VRIMALDFGTRRIGVAISDGLQITAQGAESIQRSSLNEDIGRIDALVRENEVSEIVVGLPLSMNGTSSEKTKEAMKFADDLARRVSVPVKTWDERLTSVQAEKILLEADTTRARRKHLSDKIAAQLILQSYLDSKRSRGKPEGEGDA
jgi:putative Holliday junction resolvase